MYYTTNYQHLNFIVKINFMNIHTTLFCYMLFVLFFSFSIKNVFAQNIGINETGAAPASSALLDVSSNNKGVLVPRINITNLNNAAPVTAPITSLLVYNTNTTTGVGYHYWNGTQWVRLSTTSGTVTSVTAENGLTATAGNTPVIRLGGNLNQAVTTVNVGGNTLNFTGGSSKIAIGEGAQIETGGNRSLALGSQARVNGSESVAIGISNTGTSTVTRAGSHALAIGHNVTATNGSNNSPVIAIGSSFTNSTPGSIMMGIGSSVPSLTLRQGSGTTPGNVGIGTINPQQLLHIQGTGLNVYLDNTSGKNYALNSTNAGDFRLRNQTDGTFPFTIQGSTGNIGLNWSAPNFPLHIHSAGSSFGQSAIQLTNGVSGTTSNDGVRIAMEGQQFHLENRSTTGNILLSTNGVQRMKVTAAGNVGINQTTPTHSLHVGGAIFASETIRGRGFICRNGINGSDGNTFNVNWSGSGAELWIDAVFVGNINLTSDSRLKDNINPMRNSAIERVLALQPVSFTYKNIENSIFTGSDEIFEGFIAQELQDVIPSAVIGDKDGLTKDGTIQPQTLRLAPIISVLTKAIQEQQALISNLENENAQLTNRVEELETNLNEVRLLKHEVERIKSQLSQSISAND